MITDKGINMNTGASKLFADAMAASPLPAAAWEASAEAERLAMINRALAQHRPDLERQVISISAKKDGQVIVRLLEAPGPGVRGTVLMEFEDFLKRTIDAGLTVWGESLGDKNSLRNLRGIEVKS